MRVQPVSTPCRRGASVKEYSDDGNLLLAAHEAAKKTELELTDVQFLGNRSRKTERGNQRERGNGRLKAILYTAIFVIGIFVAFKIVPAYVNEYQLVDKMQEQARFAIVNRYTEDQIRDNVFGVVQDLGIDGVKREDIKVTATRQVVKISLDYTVPVDLLLYHTDLHFSPECENQSLF